MIPLRLDHKFINVLDFILLFHHSVLPENKQVGYFHIYAPINQLVNSFIGKTKYDLNNLFWGYDFLS